MSSEVLGEISINHDMTQKFALASSDFNPLHTDSLVARRSQFGSTVVHGVCATLSALDLYFISRPGRDSRTLVAFEARYNKPIRHMESIIVSCSELNSNTVKLELHCQGVRVQLLKIQFSNKNVNSPIISDNHLSIGGMNSATRTPEDLKLEDSSETSGSIPMAWNSELVAELFPHVSSTLPDHQISLLLGTTHLVGMRCPGLNSIFGSFNLAFKNPQSEFTPQLNYRTAESDPRFSRVIISINHSHVDGEIEAFFRPEPVVQCSYSEIQEFIEPKRFTGQTALIIGGSRGLGEIAGKIIAAGGGKVFLSYAAGESDAHSIAQDIRSGGGHCEPFFYNALEENKALTEILDETLVTHIYYFASPKIEKNTVSIWVPSIFNKFSEFYLTGLAKLLEHFLSQNYYRKNRVNLFLPSTVFIDNPIDGFSEYIASKSAMEAFAKQIQSKFKNWEIAAPRLPRMSTDQTASAIQDKPISAAKVISRALSDLY